MQLSTNQNTFFYSRYANEPDMQQLLELFVRELPDRIAAMRGAARRHDFEELGRLAHQLKGAAGSYGFNELMEPLHQLETAARNGADSATIQRTLQRVGQHCQRVRCGRPPDAAQQC